MYPLLIKRLVPFRDGWPLEKDEAIRTARAFYGNLLSAMTDNDWTARIEELLRPKKVRKAKATARNVEFSEIALPSHAYQRDSLLNCLIIGKCYREECYCDYVRHELGLPRK